MSTEFSLPKFSADHKEPMEMFAHINTGHLGNKTKGLDLLVQDVKPDTAGRAETWWSN